MDQLLHVLRSNDSALTTLAQAEQQLDASDSQTHPASFQALLHLLERLL